MASRSHEQKAECCNAWVRKLKKYGCVEDISGNYNVDYVAQESVIISFKCFVNIENWHNEQSLFFCYCHLHLPADWFCDVFLYSFTEITISCRKGKYTCVRYVPEVLKQCIETLKCIFHRLMRYSKQDRSAKDIYLNGISVNITLVSVTRNTS